MTTEEQKLVTDNMKLVYTIAKKYKGYMEWEDLTQYGILGLCTAATRFNSEKGKFKDFSSIYIEGYISRAIRDCSGWIGSARDRQKGKCIKPISFTDYNKPGETDNHKDPTTKYNDVIESISSEEESIEDVVVLLETLSHLNTREQFVARGLVTGYSMKVIGESLGISAPMVHHIKSKVKSKLKESGLLDEFSSTSISN